MGEDPDRMAHPSAPYGAAQPFEPCDVAIDVPLAVEAPRNGRSAVLVKGVLLVGAALVLAAVVSQQSAPPAATASTTSVDTTTLFRGREMPKCGPTDDACCDQFSPSVTRHKGGGYNMGRCVQAGCSGSPVFNFHPAPGRPLPSFDGGQFPQGHCVPKHYRPKPGDANSPARAKREAATTSLSFTRYVGTDCHKTKHGHLRCKGKKKVKCHKTSHGNTRCH